MRGLVFCSVPSLSLSLSLVIFFWWVGWRVGVVWWDGEGGEVVGTEFTGSSQVKVLVSVGCARVFRARRLRCATGSVLHPSVVRDGFCIVLLMERKRKLTRGKERTMVSQHRDTRSASLLRYARLLCAGGGSEPKCQRIRLCTCPPQPREPWCARAAQWALRRVQVPSG